MKVNPTDVLQYSIENKRMVIWPVVICTVLTLGYAIFRPSRWDATQALLIRDEGSDAISRGGRFESVDAMQTAQETIYEMSQHPEILRAALEDVGPYSRRTKRDWPTDKQTDTFRKKVSVSAPNGAQFGRTEMIYLTVEDRTAERAELLTDAVTRHLIERMKEVRLDRYAGIIKELEKSVVIGHQQLDDASSRIQAMESAVGIDLAELRVLMDQGQGNGNVRQSMTEIESELRRAKSNYNTQKSQYEQLVGATDDPRKLITMPNTVIDNQPTLKRLKEGLVAAQLRSSQLMGVMSSRHPDLIAALKSEQRVRQQLHEELRRAVDGLQSELANAEQRVKSLTVQQELTSERMGGLASIRTRYSILTSEVTQRTSFLEEAEMNLAIARGNELSAQSVSLIQRVENPVPGIQPLGMGRKNVVLAGMFGGGLIGLGLLFVAYPVKEEESQDERTDQILVPQSGRTDRRNRTQWGRRIRDSIYNAFGRRFADYPQSQQASRNQVRNSSPKQSLTGNGQSSGKVISSNISTNATAIQSNKSPGNPTPSTGSKKSFPLQRPNSSDYPYGMN